MLVISDASLSQKRPLDFQNGIRVVAQTNAQDTCDNERFERCKESLVSDLGIEQLPKIGNDFLNELHRIYLEQRQRGFERVCRYEFENIGA